jgi:hypothetical protein
VAQVALDLGLGVDGAADRLLAVVRAVARGNAQHRDDMS